jgi:hypothetical protein
METLRRRELLVASSLGATSLVLPAAASASSPGVESDGTGGAALTAPQIEADSFVELGRPNTNLGDNSSIVLKNFNTNHRLGYVRFALTGLDRSAAAPVLTLTTNNNNDDIGPSFLPTSFDVEVYGLAEGADGYAWGESTLTWNNRPAPGTLVGGRYAPGTGATLLGEFAVPANPPPDARSFSSAAFQTFVRSLTEPSVTLILIRKDTANWNLGFFSRESVNPSQHPSLSLG